MNCCALSTAFLFGLQIENSETDDDLFGFGERAVGRGEFIAGDADGGTGGYWSKASIGDHCAGFDGRFALFVDCVDECLGRRAGKFACGFDQHHESHGVSPHFGVRSSLVEPKPAGRLKLFPLLRRMTDPRIDTTSRKFTYYPSELLCLVSRAGSTGRCNTI